MGLALLTCGIGVLVGRSRGGRLKAIGQLCLRAPAVVWLALGAQLSLGLPAAQALPPSARYAVTLASYTAVGVWLVLNAAGHRQGLRTAFAVVAAGWALNVAAIVPNGGMPVSETALARSGIPVSTAVAEGHLWKHVPATSETVLAGLGDVLPVPPLRAVVSVGDLLLFAGMAGVVAGAMRIEAHSLELGRGKQPAT